MKFHEASKLFPLLEGDDFKSFAACVEALCDEVCALPAKRALEAKR